MIGNILKKSLEQSMSYNEFKKLISDLIKDNKSTGESQSDILLNYSVLSDRRMKRLDKTIKLSNDTIKAIQKVDKNITMLVLMESWCGDGAQTLPVMNKIAELSPNIDFKVVLRDENEQLMNLFLTNNGKSIPKLILFNTDNFRLINSWGPRPSIATKMVKDYKEKYGKLDVDFKKDLQIWYNKDKGIATQKDLVSIFQNV